MIGIVNYGVGNLGSILKMLAYLDIEAQLVEDVDELSKYPKLILPGVGAFDAGMGNLRKRGFFEPLQQRVLKEKVPVLGICLGMQLLARRSEEGTLPGLCWIDADVVRFRVDAPSSVPRLKVPHMGWNVVAPRGKATLLRGTEEEQRFYFVHSYHLACDNPADVAGVANYGIECTAVVEKENIFGAQFHPEKSHKFGMNVFRNFAAI